MFKKTLAAAALAAAFAGSAYAADVTLYGIVDLGLKYSRTDSDKATEDAVNKLEMASGNQSGSRFGLKGTEELGNGYKVGFILENGFEADAGTLGQNNRLFGREARVYVNGGFGEITFGRFGNLTSGNSAYGLTGNLSPFGTSWAGAVEGSTFMVGYTRMDNTIAYKTPTFAGFTAYAQYSFDMNTKDEFTDGDTADHTEGKSSSNRYAALGVTYKQAGLSLVAVGDWYNWSNGWLYEDGAYATDYDVDDGYTFTLGGSYDFEVAKVYFGAQYFDNMLPYSCTAGKDDKKRDSFYGVGSYYFLDGDWLQFKGYGIMAGVDAPVAGGTAMFAVGYSDTEATNLDDDEKDNKMEVSRWGVSAGYTYALSKRTNVYGVAAYYQDKIDNENNTKGSDRDPSTLTVWLGMRHSF